MSNQHAAPFNPDPQPPVPEPTHAERARTLLAPLQCRDAVYAWPMTWVINCGAIYLDGHQTVEEAGLRIFEEMLAASSANSREARTTASAKRSFSPGSRVRLLRLCSHSSFQLGNATCA
jgi:hypothetical protein